MKKIWMITMLLLTVKSSYSQQGNIYDFSITKMDGSTESLRDFQGKKMVIIILPVTKTTDDSLYLDSLSALGSRHADSLQMIGVLSYEDGYFDDSLYNLQPWFQTMLGTGFMVTSGMSTRKGSAYQDALFAWLTNAAQNGHFDYDVAGTGQEFFISSQGELYGVFEPSGKLDESTLEAMLRK